MAKVKVCAAIGAALLAAAADIRVGKRTRMRPVAISDKGDEWRASVETYGPSHEVTVTMVPGQKSRNRAMETLRRLEEERNSLVQTVQARPRPEAENRMREQAEAKERLEEVGKEIAKLQKAVKKTVKPLQAKVDLRDFAENPVILASSEKELKAVEGDPQPETETEPETWQDRLSLEMVELKDRLGKLESHLQGLDDGLVAEFMMAPEDGQLLRQQAQLMGEYLHVLVVRAERAGIEIPFEYLREEREGETKDVESVDPEDKVEPDAEDER